MRRNLEKLGAFCKRFSITTVNCEACPRRQAAEKPATAGVSPAVAGSLETTQRLEASRWVQAYFQPFCAISCTAALLRAPICSADTPSALKVPKRFRIGLLP